MCLLEGALNHKGINVCSSGRRLGSQRWVNCIHVDVISPSHVESSTNINCICIYIEFVVLFFIGNLRDLSGTCSMETSVSKPRPSQFVNRNCSGACVSQFWRCRRHFKTFQVRKCRYMICSGHLGRHHVWFWPDPSISSPCHLLDFQPFDHALVDSQAWWWRTPPQNSCWQTVRTWRMGTWWKVLAMWMVWHWKPGFLMLPPSRYNQGNVNQRLIFFFSSYSKLFSYSSNPLAILAGKVTQRSRFSSTR